MPRSKVTVSGNPDTWKNPGAVKGTAKGGLEGKGVNKSNLMKKSSGYMGINATAGTNHPSASDGGSTSKGKGYSSRPNMTPKNKFNIF